MNSHLNKSGIDACPGATDVVPHARFVAASACRFHKPISAGSGLCVDIGLRIAKLGTSSASYEIGVFAAGDDSAAATGSFVCVCMPLLPGQRNPWV